MILRKILNHKSLIAAVSSLFISSVSYAQETSLLRTDDFVVTKSGSWCARNAKVRATSTSAKSDLALKTLASEIKFIFEFECPIAQHIDVDLVGQDKRVKPYILSNDTNWKLVESVGNQSHNPSANQMPESLHLSSWRPDQTVSASGQARCQSGSLAKSLYFLNGFKFNQTKKAFYDLAQYSAKLANDDRGYRSTVRQLEKEKANLEYQIESDERRRAARGIRMLGIKAKRSDTAKAAMQRLQEIGSDDPALQSIIEIAFDRMLAFDTLETELDAELSALPLDSNGFSDALAAKQNLNQSRTCIGWKPQNSTLIKFMPDIIEDHENEFFTVVKDKIDQSVRERTPFARDMLLSQIRNIRDAVSLEYFWDSFPDYIQKAYKTDKDVSRLYNSRLTILKAEAKKAREEAERKAEEEEKERLLEAYNSEFLHVALPPQTIPHPTPFLSPKEWRLVEQHEDAQLNSVGHATRLSPEICTTTRTQILYGGWAAGAASESTSCSPQIAVGKERQRKLLASKGPSSKEIYAVCAEQLKPEFCKCLSKRNAGHFTAEEFSLFSESPRAYISFIKERKFMRYTRGLSSLNNLNDSASISDFMESGAINTLMEVGGERLGNIFTGLAALMQGNTESAVDQFRKAQLMVPSNAGEITTFCAATTG